MKTIVFVFSFMIFCLQTITILFVWSMLLSVFSVFIILCYVIVRPIWWILTGEDIKKSRLFSLIFQTMSKNKSP